MMRKTIYLLMGAALCLTACGPERVENAVRESAQPAIYPDYLGVTVPVNVAPLNFCMSDESVQLVDLQIKGARAGELHAQGAASTGIDIDAWHSLLAQNAGDSLVLSVSSKDAAGRWHSWQPFAIYVSPDSIDYSVCYRLIEPGYEVWSKMGIYQCNLENYEETALIENTQFKGCVNCHSFNRTQPSDMSLHIRGPHGATLLRIDGEMTAYNTATNHTLGLCVYPYWHPSGRYIAYSTNTTRQVFHIMDANRVEVFDMASDLQVYDIANNRLINVPQICSDTLYETFPVFSADGTKLYFSAAKALPEGNHDIDSLHYNLYSISFDAATGTFGDAAELVLDAAAIGKSISFPRPNYEGTQLVFTLSDYGQFSIWHHEADLYMLNLVSGEVRAMDRANSPDTESFHNWSSNSRWMVFSSRRDDGLFTRLYFCHVDAEGRESKAYMLPQASPREFYTSRFLSYNVPDFVSGPVDLDRNAAVDLIVSPQRTEMK